jgi:hypothetical protein
MAYRIPPIDESSPYDFSSDEDDDYDEVGRVMSLSQKARMFDRQSRAADLLSIRLLQVNEEEEEDRILRETLRLSQAHLPSTRTTTTTTTTTISESERQQRTAWKRLLSMLSMAVVSILVLAALLILGISYVGPPKQPVGPYQLIERQEGMDFFDYYNFYEGRDSVGSNGYLMYVGEETALELGIVNVTMEQDPQDVFSENETQTAEPFVYMGSSPTEEGPRNSIRLEGKRRFHRGLFIIDLRHMPAGCGTWPAFWLTDESNWPVNGEIDIVEGVNYQHTAKTALHSTQGCKMDDVPQGVRTGDWDTAIGIPDRKTGIPDMTMRYATNCFVYDPKQWLNQGCVAVDMEGGTLGVPVNDKGGGVYALEWDPINRHIRTWVFTPHTNVPENLRESIQTAKNDESQRIVPDPETWPLPYGYFAVGEYIYV